MRVRSEERETKWLIHTLLTPHPLTPRSQLMFEKVVETADRAHAHNYGLLFLWASQANAVPVSMTSSTMTSSSHRIHCHTGSVLVSGPHNLNSLTPRGPEERC